MKELVIKSIQFRDDKIFVKSDNSNILYFERTEEIYNQLKEKAKNSFRKEILNYKKSIGDFEEYGKMGVCASSFLTSMIASGFYDDKKNFLTTLLTLSLVYLFIISQVKRKKDSLVKIKEYYAFIKDLDFNSLENFEGTIYYSVSSVDIFDETIEKIEGSRDCQHKKVLNI